MAEQSAADSSDEVSRSASASAPAALLDHLASEGSASEVDGVRDLATPSEEEVTGMPCAILSRVTA